MFAYLLASYCAAALGVRSVLLVLSKCRLPITPHLNFGSSRNEKLVVKAHLADLSAHNYGAYAEILLVQTVAPLVLGRTTSVTLGDTFNTNLDSVSSVSLLCVEFSSLPLSDLIRLH